ncbi:MAG: hypothetical protein QG582_794 [Candidatus Thermoplasmatota archaeon]|nr:hypothetical protein [Candidatus Thermoplasmatota archaeon]
MPPVLSPVVIMLLSHKVFLGVSVWTVASKLVSPSAGVEDLHTLELIGLLVARELTDGLLGRELKDRVDYFIYAGLFLFAVVVVRRIWLILD